MFRRQSRAIFRGIFKPNFLLSWPSVMCVVRRVFGGFFRWAHPHGTTAAQHKKKMAKKKKNFCLI
jgi:hypothetical protein